MARERGYAASRGVANFGFLSSLALEAADLHVTRGVRSSYDCAAGDFINFCVAWDQVPFPVTRDSLSSYLIWKSSFISIDSLCGVYLCGIKSHSDLLGHEWLLQGDPAIHKVVRYLKRTFGYRGPREKAAVTLDRLLMMTSALPGWPDLTAMCHDDRCWITAATHAVFGFLRGGEFAKGASGRPLLRHKDITITFRAGRLVSLVNVVHPKARWWETDCIVPCFSPGATASLCPPSLLRLFRCLSVVELTDDGPAFPLASGKPITKAWMVRRTAELWTASGIECFDRAGHLLEVGASSFRAGGVDQGLKALLPESLLKACGRWSSSAWTAYPSRGTQMDLAGAARAMWSSASADRPTPPGGAGGSAVTTLATCSTQPKPASPLLSLSEATKHVGGRFVFNDMGAATVVSFAEDGSPNCQFDNYDGVYNLATLGSFF